MSPLPPLETAKPFSESMGVRWPGRTELEGQVKDFDFILRTTQSHYAKGMGSPVDCVTEII